MVVAEFPWFTYQMNLTQKLTVSQLFLHLKFQFQSHLIIKQYYFFVFAFHTDFKSLVSLKHLLNPTTL